MERDSIVALKQSFEVLIHEDGPLYGHLDILDRQRPRQFKCRATSDVTMLKGEAILLHDYLNYVNFLDISRATEELNNFGIGSQFLKQVA